MLQLERPPRWGIATMAVAALLNAALFTYLGARPTTPDLSEERFSRPASTPAATSASESAPQPAATPAGQPETVPVLAVYGDGYSAGSSLGGAADAGWPALVAQRAGAQLELNAVSLAGYVAVGLGGQDFVGIVGAHPVPDATVTVVFGSRNDAQGSPETVEIKAGETLATIRAAAPETELIVIGPAWSSRQVPDELFAVRDAVRTAAAGADAHFLDPLADSWFSEPGSLIAADGISPTDAGHRYLAELIGSVVATALTN